MWSNVVDPEVKADLFSLYSNTHSACIDILAAAMPAHILRLSAKIDSSSYSIYPDYDSKSFQGYNDSVTYILKDNLATLSLEAQTLSSYITQLHTWLMLQTSSSSERSELVEICLKDLTDSNKACDNIISKPFKELSERAHLYAIVRSSQDYFDNTDNPHLIVLKEFDRTCLFRCRQMLVDLRNLYLLICDSIHRKFDLLFVD